MFPIRRAVAGGSLAVVVLGVTFACTGASGPKPTLSEQQAIARTISGGSVATLPTRDRTRLCASVDKAHRGLSDSTSAFAVRAGIYHWCIPEYHDDQRLHDGNGSNVEYGPIAHTLAHPDLALLTSHTQFDGEWVNVAIVDLDLPLESPMPQPYIDLGITTQHSCVYLKHHHRLWKEWYSGLVAPATTNCASPDEDVGTYLDVKEEWYSDNHADYPPVTRFIEGNGGRTLLGVMCTNRICVLGRKPIGSVPGKAHQGVLALEGDSRGNVKGWFDDQVLGAPDAAPKYRIHRMVRGSLIPMRYPIPLRIADYLTGYKPVAYAFFPGQLDPDSKYAAAFGFSQGMNAISLKAELDGTNADGSPKYKWTALITNALGATKEKGVEREDHAKFGMTSVPATARWRWRDTDEDVWVSCDIGCCLIGAAM